MHCIAHHPRTLTPRQTRAHKADINKHARQAHIPTIYNNKGSKQQQLAAMNDADQCNNTKMQRHQSTSSVLSLLNLEKVNTRWIIRTPLDQSLHLTPVESSRCWVDVESSPLALLWNSLSISSRLSVCPSISICPPYFTPPNSNAQDTPSLCSA